MTSAHRLLLALLAVMVACSAQERRTRFIPDQPWPDDKGVHINAHGGGVLFHDGTYYWFGEHKISGPTGNRAHVGVHCYRSTDLYNWSDAGIALAVSEDPASEITKGCTIERPKVIYHAGTKTFVMWFHLELKDQGYTAARSGLAVADRPTGPYTYVRSLRPDAGVWPQGITEHQKAATDKAHKLVVRDFAGGQMARDMTLFVDDDGKAYHLFASEDNATLHLSLLSDDYRSHAGRWIRIAPGRLHEAPAICKHAGRYWMITSGCTGWAPNAARSLVAESIWGPWTELGNPCTGVNPHNKLGPEKTFGGQSTFILPVAGKPGAFIAMFDIWRPKDAISGGYVWLPIVFADGRITVAWHDAWDLSVFDRR